MNEGNVWTVAAAGIFGAVVLASAWVSSQNTDEQEGSQHVPDPRFHWTLRTRALALLTILTLVAGLVRYWTTH